MRWRYFQTNASFEISWPVCTWQTNQPRFKLVSLPDWIEKYPNLCGTCPPALVNNIQIRRVVHSCLLWEGFHHLRVVAIVYRNVWSRHPPPMFLKLLKWYVLYYVVMHTTKTKLEISGGLQTPGNPLELRPCKCYEMPFVVTITNIPHQQPKKNELPWLRFQKEDASPTWSGYRGQSGPDTRPSEPSETSHWQ